MTKLVLITGVSGAIGSAAATAFRDDGWTVAGIDRNAPPPGLAVDSFGLIDIGLPDLVARLREFIESLPRLDALVNNAGLQGTATALDTGIDEWEEVMAANARGAFLAMQASHARLEESEGAVVNVASVHALATSVGAASYAASKGAMVSLTRAVALEWAPRVRVNAILPGAVDTPMLRDGVRRWAAPDGVDEAVDQLAARIPMRRLGLADEIAQAVLFLADWRRSSFVTGQTLIVDGGVLARLSSE
jgi:NAD(P)-dependent dehydrogenase (short-subunit alcohol dehydrogenase family)